MLDKLNISFEVFPEENIKVLTVARGDEAIEMFTDTEAVVIYQILTGEVCLRDILSE